MLGEERSLSYQELDDDEEEEEEEEDEDDRNAQSPMFFDDVAEDLARDEPDDSISQAQVAFKGTILPMRFSKTCLKNFFTVVLIFIYLLLTAVAAFLAYQMISDFLEKLNNPVMSVIYEEVDSFSPPVSPLSLKSPSENTSLNSGSNS